MFYCEVTRKGENVPMGTYAIQDTSEGRFKYHSGASRVWEQGTRGGVKIIKHFYNDIEGLYVTKDEKLMKEFMWVKLQAQMIN